MDQNRYSAKVKQDRSKIGRVRVRHQLRVIIADVLFETGMKVVRLSKRIRPIGSPWFQKAVISLPPSSTESTYVIIKRETTKHDFYTLYQNEWRSYDGGEGNPYHE